MTSSTRFSDRYKPALRAGLSWMLGFVVLSGLALDMGQADAICLYSLTVYGVLLLTILLRRPAKPTFVDLMMLKWSFPILYLAGFLVYPWNWHSCGVPWP